jgi:hypothetical protein
MEERLLSPDELATLIPSRRKGRKVSAQTLRRWMFQGLRGRFLRHTRVGSIPCSSEKDLKDFFAELTCDDEARRFVHVDEIATSVTGAAKAAGIRNSHFMKRAEDFGL